MKKLLLFSLLFSSIHAFAADSGDHFAEDRMDEDQTKMIKQRMEAADQEQKPSSTAIGGSRSGQLDFEKRQDQLDHDMDKQKQLYEYDDLYRKGL